MALHHEVARNWVDEKRNRLYKRVEWRGTNVYCTPKTIFSYGTHYPSATKTRLFQGKRPIFICNTRRVGFSSTGTYTHNWNARSNIERINGFIIRVNQEHLPALGLDSFEDLDSALIDWNKKGEALFECKYNEHCVLVTQGSMILTNGNFKSIVEAKKSLRPKRLGADFHKWKNYYFKPTGMKDKEFAAKHGLTIKAMRAWTRQATVHPPTEGAWFKIKARVFGSNPIMTAFELKDENTAPYISGVIYKDDHYSYGKTLYNTNGEWFKVFPMNCLGYTDI